MKKLLLGLTLIFQIQVSWATDLMRFPVYDMVSYQGYEQKFELITSPKFGKVILDCQSFLHLIEFVKENPRGKKDVIFKFYLDPAECLDIFEYIDNSLSKNNHVCIELNSFNGAYTLDREYKDCY